MVLEVELPNELEVQLPKRKMRNILSKNLKDTQKIAANFLKNLIPLKNKATVLALKGDLGSGKTAFVKCIAKELGIKEIVTSPTFVIIKNYSLQGRTLKRRSTFHASRFTNLVHVDAYRLESAKELKSLGWDEIIANPENLIAIEWAERVKSIIPKSAIWIEFEYIDERTRMIRIVNGSINSPQVVNCE